MGSCWGSKEEAQEQAVVDPHKTLTVNYDKQAAAAGNPAGQPAKRRAHKHNAGAASTSTEPESSGPLAMKVIMLGPKTARQLIVQRQWAGKANSDEPVFDGECVWKGKIKGRNVEATIWATDQDTRSITMNFIRDAHAAIIVYDASSSSLPDIQTYSTGPVALGMKPSQFALLGTLGPSEPNRQSQHAVATAMRLGWAGPYEVKPTSQSDCQKVLNEIMMTVLAPLV